MIYDGKRNKTLNEYGFTQPVVKKEHPVFIGGYKMEEKTKPIKHYRLGTIKIAVWKKEGKFGSFHTYTVDNSYKDGDEWKKTNNYTKAQLFDLTTLIERIAHEEVKED